VIRRVFGVGWQHCRVHWMRNAFAYVPKTQQSMVAAAPRQAFLQPAVATDWLWSYLTYQRGGPRSSPRAAPDDLIVA
jgi:putative transposase